MDKMLLLLIILGLVAGVALVSGTLMNTQTVSPVEPQERTKGQISEESEQDQETDVTHEEDRSDLSGEVKTLDFKVDENRDNESYTHRFRIREPDTDDEDIRIDSTRDDGAELIVILRGSTDEGWLQDYSSSEWTYFTGVAFTQMWQRRAHWYLDYKVKEWQEMEGEELRVESEEGKVRVYDIRVNRDIPDSVFSN